MGDADDDLALTRAGLDVLLDVHAEMEAMTTVVTGLMARAIDGRTTPEDRDAAVAYLARMRELVRLTLAVTHDRDGLSALLDLVMPRLGYEEPDGG
jgi:hypothetical protein